MTGDLRVCLELWGDDPTTIIDIARTAEAAGLDGVYVGESPTGLNAETWTLLGAIADATTRIRIGPVLANLLSGYRSPVLLARQGATLAALSGGRFDFRTGVGAHRRAGRAWWEPAGVPYGSHGERRAEADTQLTLLRTLWAGGAVDLGGGTFSLGLTHPPIEITVAASASAAFALAGRHADRWETSFCTVEEWQARRTGAVPLAVLATSVEVDAFIGPDRVGAERVWSDAYRARAGEDLESIRDRALIGSPADVAEQLNDRREAGIEQLVVALHDPLDHQAVHALGEAVRLLE